MSDAQHEKDVAGVVTAVYRNVDDDSKPCNVYIAGDETRYSTFDTATAAPIEEGVAVAFDVEENDGNMNIVEDSVAIIEDDLDGNETYGDTDETAKPFTPTDARIMAQSLIRSAVLFHQDREGSTTDDVAATADRFAALQTGLYRKLRTVREEGEH